MILSSISRELNSINNMPDFKWPVTGENGHYLWPVEWDIDIKTA